MRSPAITVRNVTVPVNGLPKALSGLRIAHVSDFHFRGWGRVYEETQEALLSLDPHFIFLTGDYAVNPHRWERPAELTRRLIEPLAERCPVYAVLGNHDHPALTQDDRIPVRFLRNESVMLKYGGVSFELAGIEQSYFDGEDLEAALGTSRPCEFSILLTHYPSTVFRLPPGRVDLMLAGHTHGGQIRLPFLGCVWPNDRISRRMARGLHAVGGTLVHVSAGIGVSWPLPIRFNCPPELTALSVQAVETPIQPSVAPAAAAVAQLHQGPIARPDNPNVLYSRRQ